MKIKVTEIFSYCVSIITISLSVIVIINIIVHGQVYVAMQLKSLLYIIGILLFVIAVQFIYNAILKIRKKSRTV